MIEYWYEFNVFIDGDNALASQLHDYPYWFFTAPKNIFYSIPPPLVTKLCLPFGLPRAGLYADPGDQAALLPVVYGDFLTGGIRGAVPATQIDREHWVYCAAFHPVMEIAKVYVNDVEQLADFTARVSHNYQGRGRIATITFTQQPDGPVSWAGRGIADSTGTALMENVIDQVMHLLATWGGFDPDIHFDEGSRATAWAAVEALGYKTAFVVYDEQVTQDWITEMLFNVMGYWRVNGREQIEFAIDSGGHEFLASDIAASIVAARDCVDGDDGVRLTLDRRYLVNYLTAYYLWSYASQAPATRVALTDALSLNAYGKIPKTVTLRGLRRAEDVETWATILFERQSGRTRIEGSQVAFTLVNGRAANLTTGDLIAVSWPYGPTREGGNAMVNEVFRVAELGIGVDPSAALPVRATALGAYVVATPGGARIGAPVER